MIRNHEDSFSAYPGYAGAAPSKKNETDARTERRAKGQRATPHDPREGEEADAEDESLPKRRYLSAMASREQRGRQSASEEAFVFEPFDAATWAKVFSPQAFFRSLKSEASSALSQMMDFLGRRRAATARGPHLSFWQQARLHERTLGEQAMQTYRRGRQEGTVVRQIQASEDERRAWEAAQQSAAEDAMIKRGKADFLIALFGFQLVGMLVSVMAGLMPLSIGEASVGLLLAGGLASVVLLIWPYYRRGLGRFEGASSTERRPHPARIHS